MTAAESKPPLNLSRLLLYGIAIVFALIFMGPFVWAIFSSLKGPQEVFLFPPRWFPAEPQWNNYVRIWEMAPLARFYLNSVIVTGLAVTGTVLSSTLVAYGFSRFEFPGRNILFIMVIATLILPEEVTLVPRFILFKELKWLDTYLPLTVPHFFATNAFAIFLLRQFLMSIPRDLDEAAEIDGAGQVRILWSVLVPQLKPALASVAIFSFLFNWNDFIHPLIFLKNSELFTLALGLRFYQVAADVGGEPREPYLMAASLLAAAPAVLLFFFAQRYFVRGIVMSGGSKG
jgi:ABC-type glycerol-3-phosphate transport system permease component